MDFSAFTRRRFTLACIFVALTPAGVILNAAESWFPPQDLLIADFENQTYGEWQSTGQAFGPGPANGTLPNQMAVTGYQGDRLVNSFYRGDGSIGTLTSPRFKIQRDYLTFLIGGGGHAGKTCMNLLLDGEVVRSATGPNTQPGGSERLEPYVWEVASLRGKSVTLQIVDQATGGWGHINVDQIVQTDTKPDIPVYQRRVRQFTIQEKYLIIPIENGSRVTELTLEVGGKPVRQYNVELATTPQTVDWYAFFTISDYQGKAAKITANRVSEEGFQFIQQSAEIPGSETFYTEALRPQFHFSQKVGWNNDPNGMVHLNGEWHLFFQHNPVGWKWGNMTWGHAVSEDLVHWKQLPNVLFPQTMATGACFSGGATVDKQNTAGWKSGDNDVLVAFLTDTGAGEAVAYSNDHGRSFTWYAGNPIIKHRGRDPKVIWYEYGAGDEPLNAAAKKLGGHWVMVVYDEHEEYQQNIAFYTSTDLRDWQEQSHLADYYECPELFELPVDGVDGQTRWVILAADARYALGVFDGKSFTPEHAGKHRVHYGSYYASQTFSNPPDGRRIQIGWARIAMPGMPFNQTFSFPHRLTLRETADGIRMFAKPVREIEKLHKQSHQAKQQHLPDGARAGVDVSGPLFDIRATLEIGDANHIGLDIGGHQIVYDVAEKTLNGAKLQPIAGKISLQVLVDRPMIEICGNDGAVFITSPKDPVGEVQRIEAFSRGGTARLLKLDVYELTSIWNND